MIVRSTLVVVLLFAILVGAHAQMPTTKGRAVFSGNTSFQYANYDGEAFDKHSLMELAGEGAWFVTDGLALGFNLEVATYSSGGNSSTQWGLGPALTYYFGPNGTVTPFVGASLLYGKPSEHVTDIVAGIKGGVLFMVSKSVAISFGIRYSIHNFSYPKSYIVDSQTGNVLTIPIGFAIFF